MLYLGNVLLRYVLIYNLEVSFNFHLTFLQLNVINYNAHCAVKTVFFSLLPGIFFELPITRTPDNSNFFRFLLTGTGRFELSIGSRLYVNLRSRSNVMCSIRRLRRINSLITSSVKNYFIIYSKYFLKAHLILPLVHGLPSKHKATFRLWCKYYL